MKPSDADAAVLTRAGQRCDLLALELRRMESALGGAADSTLARWSGTAAASFGAMTHAHRGTVQDARAAVERLAVLTRSVAHELADAQLQVRHLPPDASVERKAVEDRILLLRRRFHQQSTQIESELKHVLLRRPIDPPRWTGPVGPPGDWPRGWSHEPPPLDGPVCPPRWTGPIRPPVRRPPIPIRPLPVPIEQGPAAAQLPWTPPWLHGSGHEPGRTMVQPVGVGA